MHHLQIHAQTQPAKIDPNSKRTERTTQTNSMEDAPPSTDLNEMQEEMCLQPVVKYFEKKAARVMFFSPVNSKQKVKTKMHLTALFCCGDSERAKHLKKETLIGNKKFPTRQRNFDFSLEMKSQKTKNVTNLEEHISDP